ncbi:MAG: hydrogenase 3 maturation endopeptidase HyCI [Candidatus Omnitrophota bacterium]
MSNLSAEVQKALLLKSGPHVIVTVGNTLRSDDGVGPYIGSHLHSARDILIINAEQNPEGCIDEAVQFKPKRVLIIDAADFKGVPGEARLIDRESIPETTVSTHTIPLSVITSIIASDANAEVLFLGIQMKNAGMGEGLSREVKTTADLIIDAIQKELRDA